MVSQDKLIKQGINYTDKLFAEISKRLETGVKASDTLEAFLDATKEYTAKNPLISSGYDETMLRLILQETNNHKFSRPSQKELARVTIENYVGDLIVDVGEDIKDSVREIVKDGYNNNLSQQEIADNISNRVSVIKNKRARAIARTEIARTATVSDYIINKERGATHFYVECRNTACPICKEAWHDHWSKANDESFKPSDTSAGGKGWIGDKVYSMSDTGMLPPIHPNCRCVAYFVNEADMPENGVLVDTPVKQQTTEPLPSNVEKVIGEKTSNIPQNVRNNLDEFASATKNQSREFSQYYSESGKISELNKGAAHKAYRNPKVTEWVGSQAKQGEIFHFVHNHPTSYLDGRTLLSSEDITIFKEERNSHNLKSFIAEGKNVRVIIGKLDNYDEFSRSQQDKVLTNAWHIYEDEYAHSTKRGTVEYYNEIVEKMNDELNKGGFYYRVEERTVESNGEFPKANAVMEKSEIEKLEEKLRQTVDEKERMKILEKLDELSGGFYY